MSWLLLLALATIVFVNRYVFLEPRLPVRIPKLLHDALKYSAPCLLTAICGPIILMDKGELRAFPDNPYLLGTIFAVVIAFSIRKMVVAVISSLLVFYALAFILG
jgi:branched-subunit amino acid transport protein